MGHPATTAARPAEYVFSDADFQAIAQIAYREAGLSLTDNKRSLVYSRLTKRLRALHLHDFAAYVAVLRGKSGSQEIGHLLTALTTNVTAFFREGHHFEHLRRSVLPDLIARARKGGRVRIWSAAASSGEEAYSIALCVLGQCPEAARLDIRILGTDIDETILARAREARYPVDILKPIPVDLHPLFGEIATGCEELVMPTGARDICRFNHLNLLRDWPFRGLFDVIFCRNVAIYFDTATQQGLWARLSQYLDASGHLYIGHSERITGPAEACLRNTGITQYQKSSTSPQAVGAMRKE